MTARLEVHALTKSFASGKTTTVAIDDIDLYVEPGELVCIVGASGCGKSTLLTSWPG